MRRTYRKPPIQEVVCEFRFVAGEPWDLTVPGLVYERLRATFPKRQVVRGIETELGADEGGVKQQIRLQERAKFLREDDKAFVQVGPNLLAVNHLAPYPTWEQYLPLVRTGFDGYVQVAKPKGLSRLGLRYINRIEPGGERVALEEYFAFRPFVGESLRQDFGNFLVVVESAHENGRDRLRLQLGTTAAQGGRLAFILDLDYFTGKPESVAIDGCFAWLDNAHGHIGEAFEGCLTDRTRSLFEPAEG